MEPTVERSDDWRGGDMSLTIHLPQWSRPWNGRMTTGSPVGGGGVDDAAMEPTVERSDDSDPAVP